MVAGVAPAGGHKDVQQLVAEAGSFYHVAAKGYELAEIGVEETIFDHGPGDAVFDGYAAVLGLVGAEYAVPDVEQVTIVGVHIHGVARMVYPMKRRREDELAQETETGVVHQVFAYVDEGAPGAVDKHDDEQHRRIYAQQDTNAGSDDVGIRRLEKEMRKSDRQVHGFGRVVGGVQAPEQPHLMRQEMVNKMRELPHNVPVNEPIPGKSGFEHGIPGKQADTQSHHGKRNDAADERVEHIGEEGYFVVNNAEPFIECSADDLDQ